MKLRPRYPMQLVLAFVAACLLWFSLAGQRDQNISVRGVKATLTLVNLPRELVVTSPVPDTISLQLRGPLSRALDARTPPEVLLDLSDARPGVHSYTIDEDDIPLPADVEVVSVEPPAITLELERLQTRLLSVDPSLEGEPAAGFKITSVRVIPAQISVQGPGSKLEKIEVVETAPVSVEGATSQVTATVQPRLPDPQVRALSVGPLQVVVDVAPAADPPPEP